MPLPFNYHNSVKYKLSSIQNMAANLPTQNAIFVKQHMRIIIVEQHVNILQGQMHSKLKYTATNRFLKANFSELLNLISELLFKD